MASGKFVYRLARAPEIEAARAAGEYAGVPSLDVGFIHLSTAEQVVLTEEEWVDAFSAWIWGMRAKAAEAKVSRKQMVQNRNDVRPSDLSSTYFQGAKLGEGAFGEVFVMLHKSLGVERVVKVIKKDQAAASDEHIEDEVAVLKSLDHPHIVRIYETFDMETSLHIVMDYADGGDLAEVIRRMSEKERRLSEPWVRTAISQTCAALEYIHSKGVIHCDLKPANAMLLRPVGLDAEEAVADLQLPHVLLVDFGLAELFQTGQGAASGPAGPSKVKGTPLYLAPEGFEGHLSEKSDMWAVGVMLYEMLLGKRPFQASGGNIFAYWMKVAKTEPSLEELPAGAQAIVKVLLSKDPVARPNAKECRGHDWFISDSTSRPSSSRSSHIKLKTIGHHNYFHRAAMFCIATELSMKDMTGLFDVFQSIDSSGSGRLTQDQLGEGLKKLGINQDPAKMMAILDMDQNGYVSYTEFLAGALSTTENLSERLVREAFDLFDLDGDGIISKHELRLMLSGDGPLVDVLPDGQTVDEIMQEAGDGVGISFADFRKYLNKSAKSSNRGLDCNTQNSFDASKVAGLQEDGVDSDEDPSPARANSIARSASNLALELPSLFRFLKDDSEGFDEASLRELLAFPEQPLHGARSTLKSPSSSQLLSRHFLACASLVNMLSNSRDDSVDLQSLRGAAIAEAHKLQALLANDSAGNLERLANPPRRRPVT
eukprot:TRINITY_DN4068_c0_g1_i1.p1 TRINITY_DN4068_c0_g1~~TRINITY_DN4068_c0_g1_i1.p1  ORF type:complete len:711 (-),score=144.80 TRINITY_DN4068_c0_g1_i1:66-2198(-)